MCYSPIICTHCTAWTVLIGVKKIGVNERLNCGKLSKQQGVFVKKYNATNSNGDGYLIAKSLLFLSLFFLVFKYAPLSAGSSKKHGHTITHNSHQSLSTFGEGISVLFGQWLGGRQGVLINSIDARINWVLLLYSTFFFSLWTFLLHLVTLTSAHKNYIYIHMYNYIYIYIHVFIALPFYINISF